MYDMRIPMVLPLNEGFLRRECPHCERQFKVRVQQPDDVLEEHELTELELTNFCPLCHEPAPANTWWTKEQIEYQNQVTTAAVSDELHGMLTRTFAGLNQPRGPFRVEIERNEVEEPKSLDEPHDMIRVDPPCHQETPLKIPVTWGRDVACFECGIRYPVDVIRVEG